MMRFEIEHHTIYQYSLPVTLLPQTLRLQPRGDGNQRLLNFECDIDPKPHLTTNFMDLEGNIVTRLWFEVPTDYLQITSRAHCETLRGNPFDYLPEKEWEKFPITYSPYQETLLVPYRHVGELSSEINELAKSLAIESNGEPLTFLNTVNHYLHRQIKREIRLLGRSQSPEVTLTRRRGACRDLAVLFMAICRQQGFACRYVSGYQAKASTAQDRRYMHAWPEVYIAGGGWRGYDPTQGKAVADAHVAVAAAIKPEGAYPVEGSFRGNEVKSQLDYRVNIRTF